MLSACLFLLYDCKSFDYILSYFYCLHSSLFYYFFNLPALRSTVTMSVRQFTMILLVASLSVGVKNHVQWYWIYDGDQFLLVEKYGVNRQINRPSTVKAVIFVNSDEKVDCSVCTLVIMSIQTKRSVLFLQIQIRRSVVLSVYW